MAILTASQGADLYTISSGDLVMTSLTTSRFSAGDSAYVQVYTGAFTVVDGCPESGEVNTISYYSVGTNERGDQILTPVASVTGLHADVSVVWDYVDQGDRDALLSYLFEANDSLTGSAMGDILLGYDGDDYLRGKAGRDSLAGGDGNDTLDGGSCRDTLDGGMGNDVYYVNRKLDMVVEAEKAGDDTVHTSVSYTLPDNVENLILEGSAAITATGNELNNTLQGDLNSAANTLAGAAGDDLYIVGAGDVVKESSNEGVDTVQAGISYTLGANVEHLVLTGDALSGTGNLLDNEITGNGQNNTLSGKDGHDTLSGGVGNDTLDGGVGNDILVGGVGADKLIGWVGGDTLQGGDGKDLLFGDAGPGQTLPAVEPIVPASNAIVAGLSENQFATYADLGANATQLAEAMQAEVSGVTVTSATYTGSGQAASFFAKIDFDASGSFMLGQGILLTSGDGSPATSNTSTSSTQVNNQPGDADLNTVAAEAFAGAGTTEDASVLEFNFTVAEGAEKVSVDLMFGSDEYPEFSDSSYVDIAAIWIDGVNYALFNNDPTQPLSVISQNLDAGNFFDNKDGGLSIEYDGLSVPLRIVGSLDTSKTEHTIRIAIADTGDMLLDSGIFLSNLQVRDASYSDGIVLVSGYNDSLSGGAGNDRLVGQLGQDTLDGGLGVDTMLGGVGNDVYVVDNVKDVVTEKAGEGDDTVHAYIDYHLGQYVENLSLLGGASASGTGNTLANLITGNLADNVLSGLGGKDTLIGGDGNDTIDGGAGIDTVSYAYAEAKVVVDLSKTTAQDTGAAGMDTLVDVENVVGGSAADWLRGNAVANVLDGGAGADTLLGGQGDDIYIVDDAGDWTDEFENEGVDTVMSSISWTLQANVENLILTGAEDIDATGDIFGEANVIVGNAGGNVIDGHGGNDTLTGGAGADIFVFQSESYGPAFILGTDVYRITDFSESDDKLSLDASTLFTAIKDAAALHNLGVEDYWRLGGAKHFTTGVAAQDSNDYLVYDDATGNLYYDADGVGGVDQVLIAHLDGAAHTLGASDFLMS